MLSPLLLGWTHAYTQAEIDAALSSALSRLDTETQLVKLTAAVPKLARIQLANTSKETLELLILLSNSINTRIQQSMNSLYPQQASSFSTTEKEMFDWVNTYRLERGVPAARENLQLNQAAQMLADDMAKREFLDHVTPLWIWYIQRLEYVWYEFDYISENLWEWNVTPKDIVHLRSLSPIHEKNMYNPRWTEIWVGYNEEKHYRVTVHASPKQ